MTLARTLFSCSLLLSSAPAEARCTIVSDPTAAASGSGERTLPTRERARIRPGIAAGLSVIPGLGHAYACDPVGASVVPLSMGASLGTALFLVADPWAGDDPLIQPALMATQNIWFYGIYDSFRVASLMRGERADLMRGERADLMRGERQPVDRASVGTHLRAPYRVRHLRDPWVLGSVGVGLAAGSVVTLLTVTESDAIWSRKTLPWAGELLPVGAGLPLGLAWEGLVFTGVGVGEESLFRGVIQPALVDALGAPGGIVLASAIFGAAHIGSLERPGEELINVAVVGTLGGVMGYVAHRDRYVLGRAIAMHFWYDAALYTAVFLLAPDSMPWAFSLSTRW